jgi:hypothetical protein
VPQTFNVGARSLFVTLLAWALVLAGSAACLGALASASALPWAVRAGLVLSLAMLACTLGLLMGLPWARRLFAGLLRQFA